MAFTMANVPRAAWLLPVVGLAAGWGISFLVTPAYVSAATMEFVGVASPANPAAIHHDLVEFFMLCQFEVLSRTSLSAVIQSPGLNLYSGERRQEPLEDVIESMRRSLNVKIVDRPGYARERHTVFEIAFSYPDPAKAQITTQHLITRFLDVAIEKQKSPEVLAAARAQVGATAALEARIGVLERRLGIATEPVVIADSGPTIAVNVLDPASLPDQPLFPNRTLFAALGLGAGILSLGFVLVPVSLK